MDAAERAQFRLDLTVFEESAAQHGAMIPLPYARNLLGQARDALDALDAAEARIAAGLAAADEIDGWIAADMAVGTAELRAALSPTPST